MVALWPFGLALAQATLHAAVSAGGTNNAVSEVDGSDVEPDGFLRSNAGVGYLLRTPRATHQFDFTFGADVFIQRSQSVSFSSELGWVGEVAPTADSILGLSLLGQTGRTSDLDLFADPSEIGSVARPQGSQLFASVAAGQHLQWELGPDWSVGERVGLDFFTPLGDDGGQATTTSLDVEANLSRVWLRDTGILSLRGSQGRTGEVTAEGMLVTPARRANIGEVALAWEHAYNDFWASHLGAGLLLVQVPNGKDPFADVSLNGTVTHRTRTGGSIIARFDRGVYTNVFVGDVLLQNAVGLHASHPFGQNERWSASLDAEYQRSQSVFVVEVREGGIQVFGASAQLGYDWTRHLNVSFDLSYTYQDAKQALFFQNMMMTIIPPYTLNRFVGMVTLEWTYPQKENAEGPAARRRVRGGSLPTQLREEDRPGRPGSGQEGGSRGGAPAGTPQPPGSGTGPGGTQGPSPR